jgi:phosphate transport system substrate-binding protein
MTGTYPLNRSLYLITKGEAHGPVKELIELMLSPEGQAIVAERGCIPIK